MIIGLRLFPPCPSSSHGYLPDARLMKTRQARVTLLSFFFYFDVIFEVVV